jgi:hypothetical protein
MSDATQADLPLDDKSKGKDDPSALLQRQIEEQGKLIAELKSQNDANSTARKKAEEDERRKSADKDQLRKELDERDKRLEALTATVRARADLLWNKMPEGSQKKFESIRADLDPMKLIGLLEAEIAALPQDKVTDVNDKVIPPPTGSPVPPERKAGERYTPTAGATELLHKLMKGSAEKTLRQLDVKKGTLSADGQEIRPSVFTMEPSRFHEQLKSQSLKPQNMMLNTHVKK